MTGFTNQEHTGTGAEQILTIKIYQYGLAILSMATDSVTIEFGRPATLRSAKKHAS